jgi:hypothetical protein
MRINHGSKRCKTVLKGQPRTIYFDRHDRILDVLSNTLKSTEKVVTYCRLIVLLELTVILFFILD